MCIYTHFHIVPPNPSRLIGVEFAFLGLERLGAYPVHFHFCNNLQPGQGLVRGCSVHDSRLRCITVHNTMGVRVEDNVNFNNKGA
jgi:hypothetical protein